VRPVREQLEHDRVIRLLQAKYKKKFEVVINPGHEQAASVLVGALPWYPDLLLYAQDRGRKLVGTVEVETGESVNNLEAMSQWKTFSQLRAQFHLYVPSSSIDTARRMAADFQVQVAELWAYSALGDQMRFSLIQRSAAAEAKALRAIAAADEKPAKPAATPTRARGRVQKATRPASPKRPSAARQPRRTAQVAVKPARRAAAPPSRGAAKPSAVRRGTAGKPAGRSPKRK
jgi:hypothetical protein